jgi:ankyrin repeat protein
MRRLTKYQLKLMQACLKNDVDSVKDALRRVRDANFCDWKGDSPLTEAIRVGHGSLVAMLIESGKADINCQCPLHTAVYRNKPDMVKILLDNGARVDLIQWEGMTPLLLATVNYNYKPGSKRMMIRLLLDHGADPTKIDSHGKSSLDYAREKGLSNIVEMIREKVPEKFMDFWMESGSRWGKSL